MEGALTPIKFFMRVLFKCKIFLMDTGSVWVYVDRDKCTCIIFPNVFYKMLHIVVFNLGYYMYILYNYIVYIMQPILYIVI